MSVSDKPSQPTHCLIFDPVPFHGGSKVASYEIIRQSLDAGACFTVLTCDPESWQQTSLSDHAQFHLATFFTPGKLGLATQGWAFWLKQLYFMLLLGLHLLRHRGITRLVGISGPGVDMALYGCRLLFRLPVIQFVHGPVSDSRSVGYCLTRADTTFYLDSCLPSIKHAIRRFLDNTVHQGCGEALAEFALTQPHYVSFTNGLSQQQWPTPCHYQQPRLFWAASTLRWKGLDHLVAALQQLPDSCDLHSEICFIRPKNIALPQSRAPVNIPNVSWHQQPQDLDQIRARCSLFVSTSTHEPFGLSILESLAAGLCVLIPSDHAYWDTQLTHNVNCIKYTPHCAVSLANAISELLAQPEHLQRIGMAGQRYANRYRAESCYRPIASTLTAPNTPRVSHQPTRQIG